MGTKRVVGGLLAALLLVGAEVARADTNGGPYAIHEHKLQPADSYTPDRALTDGDLEPPQVTDEVSFIQKHLDEQARYTDPFLGPELMPELSAGTLMTATQARGSKSVGFVQRVDLSLYLLQIHIPSFATQDAKLTTGNRIDFDLLLPWKLSDHHRLGLLLGTSIGYPNGGNASNRFQLMYGFNLAIIDLQLRGGYAYERAGTSSLTLATVPANDQAELVYGGVLGVHLLKEVSLAFEVNGSRAAVSREDRLQLAPGIWLSPTGNASLQLGVAALFDLGRVSGGSLSTRNTGGLFSASYNFL